MNLILRLVMAVAFIPVMLWLFYLGGWPLLGFLGILATAGAWELFTHLKRKGIQLSRWIFPLTPFVYFFAAKGSVPMVFLAFFLALFLILFRDLLTNKTEGSVARVSSSSFILSYVGLFFAAIYRLRDLPNGLYMLDMRPLPHPNGQYMLCALIILVWVTDTFAYFVGMLFGRHRGVFAVSPKKSLEGFLGGIAFAYLGGWLLYWLFPEHVTMTQMLMTATAAGIFGQIGDLFESLIKRDLGTKDSSQLIPGHGGVLDRFDSLLIAAPALFLLLEVFG